jgi:L,D-peptidoglycan transpeptidase YkuD (ErfK/YbiS/YcfS/YnhG family)/putative cell wall-binding protein
MPRRVWVALGAALSAMVVPLAGPVAPAAAAGTSLDQVHRFAVPASTLQVVLARSSSWSATSATLEFFQRADASSPWQSALPAVSGRVGYGGMHDAATRLQSTGTTPAGIFALPWAFGGAPNPGARLPYRQFTSANWWVYDPADPSTYNTFQASRPASARWRTDWAEHLADYYSSSSQQYKYAVVVDYNLPAAYQAPNTRKGGGIFLHVNGSGATAGCISMPEPAMVAMLKWLDPAANPVLVSGPTSWLDDTVATPAGLTTQVAPGPFHDAGATAAFVGVARPARLQWWQLAVTDVCSGAAVASGSGEGAEPVVARWDGTVAGAPAPPGLYRMTLRAGTSSWTPSTTLTWTVEVFQPGVTPLTGCPATRVSGTDRYTTSVAIGERAAPSATTVVLASGADANLVDGLVAAPLAGTLGAPLLLTAPAALPTAVAADISRRGVVRAVVVGAAGAVSDAVLAQLHALGVTDVTRIGGATRYDTAALVARAVGSGGGTAFVASGATANLVDALSAAGPATHLTRPILLTSPDQLPPATADALAALHVTSTTVLGGTGAVSAAVAAALPGVRRLGGASRYDTAVAVAAAFAAAVGTARVTLASGTDPVVDALPGGTLGQLVLLTGPALPGATASWLSSTRPGTLDVLGGPGAVTPAALASAVAVL